MMGLDGAVSMPEIYTIECLQGRRSRLIDVGAAMGRRAWQFATGWAYQADRVLSRGGEGGGGGGGAGRAPITANAR